MKSPTRRTYYCFGFSQGDLDQLCLVDSVLLARSVQELQRRQKKREARQEQLKKDYDQVAHSGIDTGSILRRASGLSLHEPCRICSRAWLGRRKPSDGRHPMSMQ